MNDENTTAPKQPITVVVHLDVDAFYVACERELRPELLNRPLAVSQYNPYGDLKDTAIDDPSRILYDGTKNNKKSNPNANGSLIAVSYEARAHNVRRNDRGHDAVNKCPSLCVIQVPVQNGKANLTIYRDASQRLMSVLTECMKKACVEIYQDLVASGTTSEIQKKMNQIKVEKASVDEIYIDISLPVQTILDVCLEGGAEVFQRLYSVLIEDGSAAAHTTIGGLETSAEALATNSLSKNDIRKGSSLQILDTHDADSAEDAARKAWWNRAFPQAWDQEELALAVGSLITLRGRQGVIQKFNGVYTLSAGVSSNKVMAKLASGLKKPNRQTLINPRDETTLQKLFHPLPLGRIRGLGGRFGDEVEEALQVKTVGELAKVPLASLLKRFGDKNGNFLFRIAQGICDEPVTERTKAKSIGAGKTFQGVLSFGSTDHANLKKWVSNLLCEIMERVDGDNSRYPKTLVIGLTMSLPGEGRDTRRHASQSAPLPRNATTEKRVEMAVQLAKDILAHTSARHANLTVMVVGMSVSATNFVPIATGSSSILDAFQRCAPGDLSNRPNASHVKETRKTAAPWSHREKAAKRPRPGTIAAFLDPSPTVSSEDRKDAVVTPVLDKNNDKAGSSPHERKVLRESLPGTESTTDIHSSSIHPRIDTSPIANPSKSSDTDLEYARLLQAKLNNDANGEEAMSRPSQFSGGNAVMDEENVVASEAPTISVDATYPESKDNDATGDLDLEYAKQLQASFDREDQVLSSLDQKYSKRHKYPQPSEGRNKRRVSPSLLQPSKSSGNRNKSGCISKFFAKK